MSLIRGAGAVCFLPHFPAAHQSSWAAVVDDFQHINCFPFQGLCLSVLLPEGFVEHQGSLPGPKQERPEGTGS